jgi:hypothetical protein
MFYCRRHTLDRDLDIVGVHLNADAIPLEPRTGHGGGAGSQKWIQHKITFSGGCQQTTLNQG